MHDANVSIAHEQGGSVLSLDDGATVKFRVSGTDIELAVSGANIVLSNLPGSDPSVAGALWTSGGALLVSSG